MGFVDLVCAGYILNHSLNYVLKAWDGFQGHLFKICAYTASAEYAYLSYTICV